MCVDFLQREANMPTIELLKALLFESVAKLYANDYYLIARGGMETACQTRVMYYMQDMLYNAPRFDIWRQYNLDCEYNKNMHGVKELPGSNRYAQIDLVLHIRNTDANNLLVVEFKLSGNDNSHDIEKLKNLTDSNQQHRYLLGAAVELASQQAMYTFIQNAEISDNN